MKRKFTFLIAAAVMLLTMVATTGEMWGQTTIWSENFSSFSANDVPSGGTYSYACTNGTGTSAGTTKIMVEALAGGSSPELMVGKTGSGTGATGGTFTAVIPLDNYEGTLTLTYYQNKQKLSVSSSTPGVSGGQNIKPSEAGQQSTTFTGITTSMTSITIVFQATTNNNVRLDNIVLTGYQATGVAAPTFSVEAGTYTSTQSVELACETDGATIYYTTDDSTPTSSSTVYTSAISVSSTTTIKAIAKKDDNYSSIASATYTILPVIHAGTEADPYTVADARNAIDANTGLTDVYATGIVSEIVTAFNPTYGNITYNISSDGQTTSDQLQAYRGKSYDGEWFTSADDIQVGDVVVINGNLKKHDSTYEFEQDNELVSLIRKVATPTFYPEAGAVASGTGVTISCVTEGATIYYTTDGTNPTTSSNEYSDPIVINAATTIKAYAVKAGNPDSEIATAEYTILAPAATPTFSPEAGTYTWAQNVTISTTTEGATIYYTTDGSNPTSSSSVYSEPIAVNETKTIKAIAAKDGMANSDVAEATYTMNIPAINAENVNLAYDATAGSIAYTMTNPVDGGVLTAAITGGNEGSWLTLGAVSGEAVALTCSANDGNADRDATVTLTYTYNTDKTVTKVVTVTQAHFVVDYAILPFEYAGGVLSNFSGLTGTSYNLDDNGSYAEGNAPYRIKFTKTGDYLQVKTDSQPAKVTIGVKMIGGATASNITVQASANGTNFDDGEELTISGSQNAIVNLETTRSFSADVRYVRMVFTKGSNVGVGPISITKYVPKYAVNLNQPQQGQGTIASDKAEAVEGETVTLTATPNTGYAFDSWTVLDGEAQEVTVTNNAFVMPASDVEVEATFTTLPKHNIVIPVAIENNVIVDAAGNQAYATETVTISIDAPDNKVLATLTVTGNTSSDNITIAPAVNPYVDEYTFTMPDEDVTINATFDNAPSFTVSFSVNGSIDNNLEVSVTQGQSTALPTNSTLTPEGFSITGWASSNGSTEAVADPYTPTANITLFAILGQTIPHSLAINASTPNFPTSYGTANTFAEYNLAGKNFMIQQGYKNGSILQWRALGNKNGTGTMYNSEDLGKINTIILVYDSSDSNKNFTIKAGTTENPTGGTSIEPSTNGLVYTFDLSNEDYNYFVMTNGDGAGYLQSISIDYVADLNINTITTISSSQTYSSNIPATTCVIIENGAVVEFTGTNSGTAENLIINDGGQLIHTAAVEATIKKNVAAAPTWGGRGESGWYTIASPVAGLSVGYATTGTYDFYAFDEENTTWLNQKVAANGISTFKQGVGYLYASKYATVIDYLGTLIGTETEVTKPLSYACENASYQGINLMGNPFSRNLVAGDIEIAGTPLTTYYTVEGGNELTAKTLASTPIKPGQGFMVQATASSQNLVFNPTSKDRSTAKVGYISIVAGNSEFTDNAFVQVGGGNTLRKMTLSDNSSIVYVMNNGKDYASARIDALEGSMPVCFKANTLGSYTITIEAKDIEAEYLHLIDNYTLEDIDLLLEPSYKFIASNGDNPARFTLVFRANGCEGTTNDIFAFQNGSDIIVNGEGELQVFDVTGRMVMNQHVNGVQTVNVPSQGVFIFKLNEKTQKIVVR